MPTGLRHGGLNRASGTGGVASAGQSGVLHWQPPKGVLPGAVTGKILLIIKKRFYSGYCGKKHVSEEHLKGKEGGLEFYRGR